MAEQMTVGELEREMRDHAEARKNVEREARDARAEAARQAYQDSPVFEAVWGAIKGWDIERSHGEGYSGANGTDVGHILAALKPFLAVEPLSDPSERELGPFVKDSSTSRNAALDNWPRQGTQRWRIINAMASAEGGMTRDDLEQKLGLSHQTCGPRVKELIEGGWAYETDRERKTVTGSAAKVLELTGKGREEAGRRLAELDRQK